MLPIGENNGTVEAASGRRVVIRRAAIGLAAVLLLGACGNSDEPSALRTADEAAVEETTTTLDGIPTTTVLGETTTTLAGASTTVPGPTSTTAGGVTTSTMAGATTTTTGAVTTTTAPAGTTTTAGPTTTVAPSTTTTRALEPVPAMVIPAQACENELGVAFPLAVDQAKLKADLEAQGYSMPSPTMFRDGEGTAISNPPERNVDRAQKKINECAAARGAPVGGTIKRGSASQGSHLAAQLAKEQLDALQFKNYTGTTVTGP